MKLNQVFSHNMVLQAEKRVFVFGEGEGKACVSIDGMKAEASSRNGKWIAELPCHGYGGPYDMNVNLNGEEIVLRNVYFGDVVLLAGQSNLQLKLFETNTPESEYETNSLVRSFILRRPEEGEFYFPEDGWIQAHKDNVGKWPAIGYLAAKEGSKRTGHAVGIIGCYQGASMIQS